MQAIRNLIDGVQELVMLHQSAHDQGMTGEALARWAGRIAPQIDALDQLQAEAHEEAENMARERFNDHCLAWERDE